MTRYESRTCSVCGQEIEPGDVAVQVHGFPRHYDCDDVEGVPA